MVDVSKDKIGSFELTTNTLFVTDPCYSYDYGTSCQAIIDNALPGKWIGFVTKSDQKSWGIRVATLEAYHEGVESTSLFRWEEIPTIIGVDSGQVGIFDLSKHPGEPGDFDNSGCFYDRCCNTTLSKEQAGAIEEGVVSSSGFGDGGYKCEILKYNDKVLGVKVTFIGDTNEE